MQTKEQWTAIRGYTGYYAVSTLGRIRSLTRSVRCKANNKRTVRERILRPITSKQTPHYVKINLYKCGKLRTFLVHRLVAQAFLPNPEHKPEVNHLKLPKANNAISNLEWATKSENDAYTQMVRARRSGEDHPCAKLRTKDVLKARDLHVQGWKVSELADKYSVTHDHMKKILLRKNWRHV